MAQGLQILALAVVQQPRTEFANMHPYSLICADVIAFKFLLTIFLLYLTDKRSVCLENAFKHRFIVDKLTINVCESLVQQTFLGQCWLAHWIPKNGPNKNCFIQQCYCFKQLVPTSQHASRVTTVTNFSYPNLNLTPHCLPCGGLGIWHV